MSPPGEGSDQPDDGDVNRRDDSIDSPPEPDADSEPVDTPAPDDQSTTEHGEDNPGRRVDRNPTGERTPERAEWRSEQQRDRPPERQSGSESRSETQLFVYDLVSSVLAVAVVGAYLFAVSGVWPPLVAVESESMVPNMQVNDLVFVMEEHRFPGENAQTGTGVVTAHAASDGSHQKFGQAGDVIVYGPNGNSRTTPIIHRAMFWIEAGENWCEIGDPSYLAGLEPGDDRCIADHAGFITKGDNNNAYDQANGLSEPVKPEWVVGTAEFRIPGLGWIRLATQ